MFVKLSRTSMFIRNYKSLLGKAWMVPDFSVVVKFVWSVETNNYCG